MQLFYNSDIKQGATTFFFDKEESKHIVKVLRKKEIDKIFNSLPENKLEGIKNRDTSK